MGKDIEIDKDSCSSQAQVERASQTVPGKESTRSEADTLARRSAREKHIDEDGLSSSQCPVMLTHIFVP